MCPNVGEVYGGILYHLADVKGNAFPEKSTVSFVN